jgi:putative nucleotidyltransferase with HDIG domain
MMDTIQLSEKTSRDSYEKLQRALGGTINALSSTTEFRDPYTAGHQRRVAKLAIEIAKRMHLSDDLIQSIAAAAILHDIGKINIPSEILSKPGKLSDIEMKIVRTHPVTSYEILKRIDYPWPVHTIALQHHERLNGSGYPNGLKGKDICIESRILAVADVVEAMASHRPYRSALGIEAALAEISQNSGTLYDTEATEICLAIFTENQFSFDDVNINSE